MLTIKTNANNCKLTYTPLNVSSISTGETVNDDITIITGGGHNLRENDEVVFIRQDGESISYLTRAEVKDVADKKTFTVNGFDKYLIEVNGYKQSFIRYSQMISKIETSQDIPIHFDTVLYLNADPYLVEITGETIDSSIIREYGSSLISVEIGTDIETIEDSIFIGCYNLTSVTIPNSVTSIGDYAFYGCSQLKNIYIGDGIKYIGKQAFYLINEDAEIYITAKEPPVLGDSYTFRTTLQIGGDFTPPKFFVPIDVLNIYKGIYMMPSSLDTLNSGIPESYICLNTDEHIFVTNKDEINVKRRYLWDTKDEEFKYDGALVVCDDDYFTFDDLFLIQSFGSGNTSCQNNKLNITATTVGYEPILLTNCLIGVDFNGNDDKYHIYIPYDENIEFASKLEDNLSNTTFTSDDIRFLYDGNNEMVFGNEEKPGSYVSKVCGDIEVDFNIGSNFEVNLHNEEQTSNYIEKIKKNNINKIIDYERYQYTPMYYDGKIPEEYNGVTIDADEYLKENSDKIDDKLKRVNEIKFRLYFRKKDFTLYDEDGSIIAETGDTNATDYVDFGTWQTDDTGYWNNYDLRSDGKCLVDVYKGYNIYGDLLGNLGFTDDDVYFQKDAFKKSFLRLSFYDSPNRETQKLLYYSTIYFDTNVFSSNYIKGLNAWREDETYTPRYNQLVFAYDIADKFKKKGASVLTAEMSCSDKYDDSRSSDGFYLHLFDKLVSGNTCTPIYMKAEFNNAKFGKTVPMIRPIFGRTNRRIPPTNSSFPREYMRGKKNDAGDVYNWVDMNMLLQDMYTKLYIKYDFNTQQFVWFVPQSVDTNINETLTFEFFEPRVKGYDFGSYDILHGNDVGYGTTDGKPDWFHSEFNTNYEWITESGQTESEWASEFDGCCLMTTAVTIEGENILDGTKLFNNSSISKIDRIWIDGMMINPDAETGVYETTHFQLPDISFTGKTTTDEYFLWTATTTQEMWSDVYEDWFINPNITPKKIHSVNYYFKTNKKDQVSLIDELYLGINNNKKTKEITDTLWTDLKSSIPSQPSETLPSGMFSEIQSLRCVNIVKHGNKNFTTIGNGAFGNCQNLIKINIDNSAADIIGKNCFAGCRSVKTADLENTKIILREAFQGCYTLSNVTFSNGLKYIGCGAFGNTRVRNIQLPNSILRIGNSAFRRCYQLSSFNITGTNSVLTIGKRIFAECAILKYNLVRQIKSRYNYYGGTPDIIQYFLNNGNTIVFYDARSNKYVTLSLAPDKDRGKIMYHYRHINYYQYINREQLGVLNFEDWYNYLF
jgi:hypothetical protein